MVSLLDRLTTGRARATPWALWARDQTTGKPDTCLAESFKNDAQWEYGLWGWRVFEGRTMCTPGFHFVLNKSLMGHRNTWRNTANPKSSVKCKFTCKWHCTVCSYKYRYESNTWFLSTLPDPSVHGLRFVMSANSRRSTYRPAYSV